MMNLIEAFEKSKVNNFPYPPDKVVESVISKLFFYRNKVFKVYKRKKYFFGDLSSFSFRKKFYQEDFYWNHTMAPSVYVALRGVKEKGGYYEEVNLKNAQDFYIEMNKIDVEKNLTNLLLKRKINRADLKKLSKEMMLRIQKITKDKKESLKALKRKGWLYLLQEDFKDLRGLLYMSAPSLPKKKSDEIMNALEKVFKKEEYFKKFNPENLSLTIDNHSDNIIFLNDKIEFIDIMPPKEAWRVGDPYFNICRPAVDVMVLGNINDAEAMYHTYDQMAPTVPLRVKTIYEIRSSLIRVSIFYTLRKNKLAKKYLNFTEEKLKTIL